MPRVTGMKTDFNQHEGNLPFGKHFSSAREHIEIAPLGIYLEQIYSRDGVFLCERVDGPQLNDLDAN